MAAYYKRRPSEILNIDNDWLAYCVDEALAYIDGHRKEDGVVMVWDMTPKTKTGTKTETKTISPSSFYKRLGIEQ